jgi:hypothetical protein
MYCLAGVSGHIDDMLLNVRAAGRIHAIDGCPKDCARQTLAHAGFTDAARLRLAAGLIGGIIAVRSPGLLTYMTVSRFTLDAHHFWIACGVGVAGLLVLISNSRGATRQPAGLALMWWCGWCVLGLVGVSGGLMLCRLPWVEPVTRIAYTVFDVGLLFSAAITSVLLFARMMAPEESSARESGSGIGG